jgi:tetratricopeptide (TPR) repeat protein
MLVLVVTACLAGCAAMHGAARQGPPGAYRAPLPAVDGQGPLGAGAGLFDEAVAEIARLEYAAAADKLTRALPAYERMGDRARAAETLFWLGYCHEKEQLTEEARRCYGRLVAEYPGSRAAEQARLRLGRMPR